ncbi:MAG: hypothetical protein U5K37_10400 [Natrialbaceae archaeon]|nr:hypothetical protein [Natrialbaceae archaeon]
MEQGGSGGGTEPDDHTPSEIGSDGPRHISRRRALRITGLVTGGFLAGTVLPESRREWCHAALPASMGLDREFWLTDDRLQDRPIWSLSLPGTHHASFYEQTESWVSPAMLTAGHVEAWTRPQSRDVATQLSDGIRWLDIRPHYDPDETDPLWAHHNLARGPPLEEIVADIGAFLERAERQAGNEFVLVKLSNYNGFETATQERIASLQALLERHLGEYALALPDRAPAELLDQSLSLFDGPRVGLLYDGHDPWPGVADDRSRWVRDGWVNEPALEDAHEAALELTHTDTARLGEIGYYITPTTGHVAGSVTTGWIPGSSRWLAYRSLEEAARRMAQQFPCFLGQVGLDWRLNPNVLTVDFYETSAVVAACQYLSLEGLHGWAN